MSPRRRRPWSALALLLLLTALTTAGALGARPVTAQAPAPPAPSATFRLATFNILGIGHTEPGGRFAHYAPWRLRADLSATWLERRGVSLVGLQEVERDQLGALHAATNGVYGAHPGLKAEKRDVLTQIFWRKSEWELLATQSITIPFMRWQQRMPIVKLRQRATGKAVWVINVHNAPGGLQDQRDQATRIEIRKINELRATGLPVLFIGDMNERDKIYCRVTSQTDLTSPAGGSNGSGACQLPRNRRIDWIFGSPRIAWEGYALERPPLVAAVTDHHVPTVRVTLP